MYVPRPRGMKKANRREIAVEGSSSPLHLFPQKLTSVHSTTYSCHLCSSNSCYTRYKSTQYPLSKNSQSFAFYYQHFSSPLYCFARSGLISYTVEEIKMTQLSPESRCTANNSSRIFVANTPRSCCRLTSTSIPSSTNSSIDTGAEGTCTIQQLVASSRKIERTARHTRNTRECLLAGTLDKRLQHISFPRWTDDANPPIASRYSHFEPRGLLLGRLVDKSSSPSVGDHGG